MKEILLETNQANRFGLETCNTELGNECLQQNAYGSLTNCVSTDKAFLYTLAYLNYPNTYGKGKKKFSNSNEILYISLLPTLCLPHKFSRNVFLYPFFLKNRLLL